MTAPLILTIPAQMGGSLITFSFDAVQFSEGSPQDATVWDAQLIQSPSVNLSRMRNNRFDYPSFTLRGWHSNSTFDLAVQAAADARSMQGMYCTMSLIMQGVTYAYGGRKFYILRSQARPVPGPFIGGTVSDAAAHTIAEMTLKGTG